MKAILFLTLILLVLAVSTHSQTGDAGAPSKAIIKDPALGPVVDDPKLPRVLLIGDSISMGYTVPVRELLKGKANVHRALENCGPTTNGLVKLSLWLGSNKWDVIHFNFGLHDLRLIEAGRRRITLEEYEKNLREIVARLKATDAKLVWANTTPIPGPASKLARVTEDAPAYNTVAEKVMKENQVPINDLYSFALPQSSKIQRPENVHYTDEGYRVLARQVALCIEPLLPKNE